MAELLSTDCCTNLLIFFPSRPLPKCLFSKYALFSIYQHTKFNTVNVVSSQLLIYIFYCSKQNNNKLPGIHDQNTILDVSSGYLHLAGDLLVPESINKNCLEDAIVLQQVDKKFIPVVAGRTLAVVDQVHLFISVRFFFSPH